MAGRADPPEEPPENPAGGEDEYRSLVFDESFVRAARLQEFSAQERMGEHARAVRSLPRRSSRKGPGLATTLIVLVALAFATAVYIGFRQPLPTPVLGRAQPLEATVVPLAPRGAVPGGTPQSLIERGPAAHFRIGAAGINLPAVRRTDDYSATEVMAALATVKDFLVESSLNPDVLGGRETETVKALLDPDQAAEFDLSTDSPSGDARHPAAGWLVRFDPARTELADPTIRVFGTLAYSETDAGKLEVVTDHTFTYALRPVVNGPQKADGASLFTVHRLLHFLFDRDDLRLHRLELRTAYVQAGPQSCSSGSAPALRPLLAGERADPAGPAGTDPYATGTPAGGLCGTLRISPALGQAPPAPFSPSVVSPVPVSPSLASGPLPSP
ncbi:hypothetical protein [Streptomyces sp. NBC_00102]|uniref:SCO2583 family membrane protein n=1 Tax=Streptomyces sp. NBC_00102 TaxID=2975652 RepID=UPI0022503CD6|nr:hypothetical protein [Streptomyces sp. NBC_00102]MCX5396982.1 hypothetical protein [Streptomyces sp. NBC_00102]